MKQIGGNRERHFLVSGIMSAVQLVVQLVALPETLSPEKRRSVSDFFASLGSLNPLSFLTVRVVCALYCDTSCSSSYYCRRHHQLTSL